MVLVVVFFCVVVMFVEIMFVLVHGICFQGVCCDIFCHYCDSGGVCCCGSHRSRVACVPFE